MAYLHRCHPPITNPWQALDQTSAPLHVPGRVAGAANSLLRAGLDTGAISCSVMVTQR